MSVADGTNCRRYITFCTISPYRAPHTTAVAKRRLTEAQTDRHKNGTCRTRSFLTDRARILQFIMEMFSNAASSQLTYYRNVYNYIKGLSGHYWVVGNPGTQIDQQYLDIPAADALVNFEGTQRIYRHVEFADWVYDEPANQFGHLVYKTRNARAMRNVIRNALQRNAGMVYVTNDELNNPWDTLPSYWEQEVRCIEIVNQGADRC